MLHNHVEDVVFHYVELAPHQVGKHQEIVHCRIVIPASPPGVYPAVEFQDGDLRTKSSMVTRGRRDLDRFGPQRE